MTKPISWAKRTTIAAISTACFGVCVGLTFVVWTGAARALGSPCEPNAGCPGWEELASGEAIDEAFHLQDRHGRPIAVVAGPPRMFVPLDDLPDALVQGYVAVEDRRFWSSLGVDGLSIYRAAILNLWSGEVVSGASTIPMQLVRTVWASEMQEIGRWERKLYELWIAPRMVLRLGRERTLELYLNSVYLGDGVYGVEAASRHYFGVPADSLSLGQIATLIGLTRTPGRYHPRQEPDRSRVRRDIVLGLMVDQGVISGARAQETASEPLAVAEVSGLDRSRSYVTAAVTRELRRRTPDLAGIGGLRIRTTVDSEIQAAGEAAIEQALASVEAGERGRLIPPRSDVRLQASGVAIDPATGAIRGLVGGRDFGDSEHDRATQSRRPVGSLVKPILLAAALESGAQLHQPISAAPISFTVDGELWSPADHVEESTITLADMLALSSNRAAVRLGRDLGIETLQEQARSLGLDSPVPGYPSAFLGAFDAALLDIVSSYAPFANGGRRVQPYLIESIHSRSGVVLYQHPSSAASDNWRAISRETSWLVLQAMREVVTRGTGWRVRDAYAGPAAGKTGTSDGGHDAWFVGFTPDVAAGVWLGYDLPAPITAGGSGGTLAAPVWGEWMGAREIGPETPDSWPRPSGVSVAALHEPTGMLLPEKCDDGFRRGLREVLVTDEAPRAISCVPMDRIEDRARLPGPSVLPGRRENVLQGQRLRLGRGDLSRRPGPPQDQDRRTGARSPR